MDVSVIHCLLAFLFPCEAKNCLDEGGKRTAEKGVGGLFSDDLTECIVNPSAPTVQHHSPGHAL